MDVRVFIGLLFVPGIAVTACKPQAPMNERTSTAASKPTGDQIGDDCAQPALIVANGDQTVSSSLGTTRANFAAAFRRACAKGDLEQGELFDPKAADQGRLFLINAPEANGASIYLSEANGNRMVLEYPFLTNDEKSQAPSAHELEEAIYCAMHGSTEQEQTETGRCLPD